MRVPVLSLAIAFAASLALMLGGTTPALAEGRGFPCGRVTAYTAPTASTAGSIRIGTTTYVANAGSLPNPPPPPLVVGGILCLTGKLDATGAFTSLEAGTLGEQVVCGTVQSFTPASSTAAGTLTLLTNASWTMPVRAGVTLTATQTTGVQCFKFEINADGNTEVVGYSGTGPTPIAGQLPSTSTAPDTAPVIPLALSSSGLLVLGLLALRRRRALG